MALSTNAPAGAPYARALLDAALFDAKEFLFPFRDGVLPGESGQGYALRMAEENGLGGLPQLKQWLGKSRFAVLDAADAPLLSRWFGADERSLEFSLGRVSSGRGEAAGYVYAGQKLGRSYFLKRSYPRVCPACIRESGRCSLAWDISPVVACPRHRIILMDSCSHCQHPVSWSRPGLRACSCGVEWDADAALERPTSIELSFARWVGAHVEDGGIVDTESEQVPRLGGESALMTLLKPLSLDGGLHITYALGTASGYDEQHLEHEPRQRVPLKKARRLLRTADALAEKVLRLEPIHFRIQHPSVIVQLLAECASAQADQADRNLAHSLLLFVFRQKARTSWAGRHPQLSQLPLF